MARIGTLIDDCDLATAIAQVLTEKGHEVLPLSGADDVEGHLKGAQPDLLIVDAWWDPARKEPALGERLVREAHAAGVSIIACSGGPGRDREETGRGPLGVPVLHQPFGVEELERLVEEQLAG
jgi:DNA-binding response OmpR family regulator